MEISLRSSASSLDVMPELELDSLRSSRIDLRAYRLIGLMGCWALLINP